MLTSICLDDIVTHSVEKVWGSRGRVETSSLHWHQAEPGPHKAISAASVPPGPRFDYKLAWLDRLHRHARTLLDEEVPTVLSGDFNVVPTNADIYNWWPCFDRKAGFRMDFLLASPQLLPRVTGDGVDREYRGREKSSDHTPVWMELAWP